MDRAKDGHNAIPGWYQTCRAQKSTKGPVFADRSPKLAVVAALSSRKWGSRLELNAKAGVFAVPALAFVDPFVGSKRDPDGLPGSGTNFPEKGR